MRARRARRHPVRWFRSSEQWNGVRLVDDQPRFPLPEVARSSGWLAVWLPVGVLGAVCVAWVVWCALSWGWGL